MNEDQIRLEVIRIIEKLRPYVQNDGGDIRFDSFVDGIVYVRMTGACVGCVAIDQTIKDGLESILLEDVPGVIAVEVLE